MCQATVYLKEEKIMEDVMWQVNGKLRLALDKLGPCIASRQEGKLERAGC
jgi:predicted RNA-binding protein